MSTALCVEYLLDEVGFHFVLTRRLNSDPVEQFFGSIRQIIGVDFQSHARAATQAVEKLLRTGITYCSVDGNVPLRRQEEREYLLLRSDGPSKKRAKTELTYLPSSFLLVLDELLVGPCTCWICFLSNIFFILCSTSTSRVWILYCSPSRWLPYCSHVRPWPLWRMHPAIHRWEVHGSIDGNDSEPR